MMRLMTTVLLVLACAALAGSSALAAAQAGGKGGGSGSTTSSSATLTATPNPAAAWGTRVEINGCGYDPNYSAEVRIVHSAGYTETYGVAVWYTGGCLNPTPFLTREPGTYTIEVYQRQRQWRKPKLLKASTTLTVFG